MALSISICIPTFNRAPLLANLLESIFEDSDKSGVVPQVVVSDNGSTDNTTEICRNFMARGLQLKYILQPKNMGADINFLNAVKCADGEYCLLMGDDDAIRPGLLTYLSALISKYNPDVFVSERIVCDKNLTPRNVHKCGARHTDLRTFLNGDLREAYTFISQCMKIVDLANGQNGAI